MAHIQSNEESLKQAVKESLTGTLYEQREFLGDLFAEVLEDFALAEAICQGRETNLVDGDEVFQMR